MTVFPVQLAKSSILWNPIIYICMNKSVRYVKKCTAQRPFFVQFQVSFHHVLSKYFPRLSSFWSLEPSPTHPDDLGTMLKRSFRNGGKRYKHRTEGLRWDYLWFSFRKKLSLVATNEDKDQSYYRDREVPVIPEEEEESRDSSKSSRWEIKIWKYFVVLVIKED